MKTTRITNRRQNILTTTIAASVATLITGISAHAEVLIYEPFADSNASLTGNAVGTGLTGTWAASTGLGITAGSPTWGALPTSGNRVAYTGAGANTTASVGLGSALNNSGLLTDGSALWFSLVFNTPTNNGINEDMGFILGTDTVGGANGIAIANSGSGFGFAFNSGGLRATSYASGTRSQATGVALTTNTTYLISAQLIFGTSGAADTVKLYLPNTGLVLGNVQSSISAALTQSGFDTFALGMKNNTALGFDEIRLGGTYLDSIGMSATSAYWDLNDTASGAGGATPSATWNAGDLNWNPSAAGTGSAAAWTPGQTAVFSAGSDATGSYSVTVDGTQSIGGVVFKNGTVNISGGTALDLVSAGGAIEVRDATKTATISTPISQSSGSGALYKEGGGTVILSGNNTHAGPTIVNAGKLVLSGDNTGAAGATQINGGITQFDSLAAISGSGRSVTVGASAVALFGSTLSDADTATGLGRVVTASAGIIAADNNAGGNFNLNTAGLTAVGFGAVGTVNYTGTLTPNGNYRLGGAGGTLTMANTNALTGAGKTLTVSGPGTVILAASNNYTGATTIGSGATLVMSSTNSATTTTVNAGGTLVVGNGSSTGGAGVTLNGSLVIGAPTAFSIGANQVFFSTGAKISSDSTTPRSIAGRLNGNANNTVILGDTVNTGKLTFTVAPSLSSSATTYQTLSDVEFSAGFSSSAQGPTKSGAGTMILSGTNLFTGATTISAGVVEIGGGGTLNSGNYSGAISIANTSSGTLRFNSSANQIFGGAISGAGALVKNNSGTLTVNSVSNGLTGATSVNGGTLLVGLGGSLTGTTTTVNTGGTLGGAGTMGPVILNGGTIAPGTNAGILNSGNVTFSGGTAAYEINGTTVGTNYDQLNVTGTVTFTADTALTISLGYTPAMNDAFTIISNNNTDAITLGGFGFSYLGNSLTEGEQFTASGQDFTISYAGGSDNNDVVLIAVPEPGSALMLVGGLATLLGFRRRRA